MKNNDIMIFLQIEPVFGSHTGTIMAIKRKPKPNLALSSVGSVEQRIRGLPGTASCPG
jgi:hypothetical protein